MFSPQPCRLHNTPMASYHNAIHVTSYRTRYIYLGRILPRYITLSCNPRGLMALLCGSFFDPTIECNVVSSWFQAMSSIIDAFIENHNCKGLIAIMARREPSLAPLWLGATMIGLAKGIIQAVRLGTPPIKCPRRGLDRNNSLIYPNFTVTFDSRGQYTTVR